MGVFPSAAILSRMNRHIGSFKAFYINKMIFFHIGMEVDAQVFFVVCRIRAGIYVVTTAGGVGAMSVLLTYGHRRPWQRGRYVHRHRVVAGGLRRQSLGWREKRLRCYVGSFKRRCGSEGHRIGGGPHQQIGAWARKCR